MRAPLILLGCAAAGMLGGGALIGVWCLGVCLIFCALVTGAVGFLTYDFPDRSVRPQAAVIPGGPMTVRDVLDRARAS